MKKLTDKNEIFLLVDIASTHLISDIEKSNSKKRLLRELDEIDDNRDIYIKLDNKKPIAMIQLIYKNADNDTELANGLDIAHIHDLEVRKELQGLGIGREMVRFIEEVARKQKIKTLTLGVDSTNPRAIKLYESMGYNKFKEEAGRTAEEKLYLLNKTL